MINTYLEAIKLIEDNPRTFEGLENLQWFKNWLAKNNFHLLLAFQGYAFKLRIEGNREYYSARAIWQRMRWDTFFADTGSQYKLSDHATPYLARLIMLGDPALKKLFNIKNTTPEITQDYLDSL